ncbi:MAG: hypothetical protein GY937_09115 [bacterium]|nr:hypothetical protein [bacterium]
MTSLRSGLLPLTVLAALLVASPSGAWKPYTHNTTAFQAYDDAISCDDPVACASGGTNEGGGDVEVNGNHYALDPALVTALRSWPAYYNAGVIGPDGFPDLTYGQSTIHPELTGEWLQHVLSSAWADQDGAAVDADGNPLTAEQKEQALAFAYGFLTHAAGDMWGHTMVNDFARGAFPGVADVLSRDDDAGIAIRHTIAEGYVGDATPGFDGNSDRGLCTDAGSTCASDADCSGSCTDNQCTSVSCTEDSDCNSSCQLVGLCADGAMCTSDSDCSAGPCDFSDDSSPAISFAAPSDFIYRTLIDPSAATPLDGRGPLIGFFLDLRADLASYRDGLNGDLSQVDDLTDLVDDFQADDAIVAAAEGILADIETDVAAVNTQCAVTTETVEACITLPALLGGGEFCSGDASVQCDFQFQNLCNLCTDVGGTVSNGECFPPAEVSIDVVSDPLACVLSLGDLSVSVAAASAQSVFSSVSFDSLPSLSIPPTPAEISAIGSFLTDNTIVADAQTAVLLAQQSLEVARELLLKLYIDAWIDDIDQGLRGWPEGVGLATTRGLFDPQARRDFIQNTPGVQGASGVPISGGCANLCNPAEGGDDTSTLCVTCEAGIGLGAVTSAQLDPFLASDIPKMLGFPDDIVDLQVILFDFVGDLTLTLVSSLRGPLNPLVSTVADVQIWFSDLYILVFKEVFGIDVEALDEFLYNAPQYICLDDDTPEGVGSFDFPAAVPSGGDITLFPPSLMTPDPVEEDDRLDDFVLNLVLPQMTHHEPPPDPNFEDGCGPLKDEAEVAFGDGAADAVAASDLLEDEAGPLTNTVTLSKLLLLGGSELNRLLGDMTGRTIATYADGTVPANVMVNGLGTVDLSGFDPAYGEVDTWLRSIDGDHHWRKDGAPRFCDLEDDIDCCPSGAPFCTQEADHVDQDPTCGVGDGPCPREALLNGGNGNMPLFESCVLRPAFRELFIDWENGDETFPDLNDDTSADPSNDPSAPAANLAVSGSSFVGANLFVAAGNQLTLSAVDTPAGQGFADEDLALELRVYASGDTPGSFAAAEQGETFSLVGVDGDFVVEYRSGDPCHPIADVTATMQTATLDTTAPTVSCGGGSGGTFDTDTQVSVSYSADDGDGAGVASAEGQVDGFLATGGTAAAPAGSSLDAYELLPGTRTVLVDAEDEVANADQVPCEFEVHATSESLVANLERATTEGDIPESVATTLQLSLSRAQRWHRLGQFEREKQDLQRFADLLGGAAGQVNAQTSARLVEFALDAIQQLPASGSVCGIGIELVLLVPLVRRLRLRRRNR